MAHSLLPASAQMPGPPSLPYAVHVLQTLTPSDTLRMEILLPFLYCLSLAQFHKDDDAGPFCSKDLEKCQAYHKTAANIYGMNKTTGRQRKGQCPETFVKTREDSGRIETVITANLEGRRKEKKKKKRAISFHFQKKNPVASCLRKAHGSGTARLCVQGESDRSRQPSRFLDPVHRLKVTQSHGCKAEWGEVSGKSWSSQSLPGAC